MSNEIKIRIMTTADYPAVKELLRHNFYNHEPLCMSSGENVEEFAEKDIDDYNLYLISHGASLIAFQNERIVGCVIAGKQVPEDIEKHAKEAATMGPHIWGRILRFLSKVEHDADIFGQYNVNKVLYSHMTNVDASLRGQGFGARLAEKLMDVGRAQGYPLMLAYCTSFYSARQKAALGMNCAYELDYASYKDEQGKVVFAPPEPHKRIRVMAMKL